MRPEIPQNTGSIARLAAAIKARLHLVGPLGFSLEDRYLKRAGLDYWPLVDLRTYDGWEQFVAHYRDSPRAKSKFFSTHASRPHISTRTMRAGDFLFFGGETKGLGTGFLCRENRTARIGFQSSSRACAA